MVLNAIVSDTFNSPRVSREHTRTSVYTHTHMLLKSLNLMAFLNKVLIG